MHLPTVRIKHPEHTDGIVINETDFDEDVHERHGETAEEAKKLTVAEMRAELTARGVAIPEGAKKADLRALLDA